MATIIEHPNSEWPNGLKVDFDGYVTFYPLGTNKVDISTIDWPDGDELISPYVYKNGKLVGFVDTEAITVSGSATTTMNYSHIEANFSSIVQGTLTVDAPNATVKKFKWATVQNNDGSYDYVIIDFNTTDQPTIDAVRAAYRVVDKKMYDLGGNVIGTWDTSKLEVAGIYDAESYLADGLYFGIDFATEKDRNITLTEFNSDLSSLTDGSCMFGFCYYLSSFTSDLSSLSNGDGMFTSCPSLTSFTSDMSSLTNGYAMFESCANLTTFTSDLSSLTNGLGMFYDCGKLTTFTSNLSSLTDGDSMFYGCNLDSASVKNIIDTINTSHLPYGTLTLGIRCNDRTDANLFAQEIGYADLTSLTTAFNAKGWFVTIQATGKPTSTYSMRKSSEESLPVYVKLIEVEETRDKLKSFHTHTSIDGTKKYRLKWFHFTNGSTEGYAQYASLEEAIEALNIKPIERN